MPAPHEGLPVSGYQPQAADRVALVNHAKALEEAVLRHLDALMADKDTDKRWASIARTQIEEGFMAANRAVFKPSRIALPGD
jgi:hypothetical protein